LTAVACISRWCRLKMKSAMNTIRGKPCINTTAGARHHAASTHQHVTLLRICCILPLTTCTAERAFSAMKMLKRYFSTMTDDRLTGLALIYIHPEVETFQMLKSHLQK